MKFSDKDFFSKSEQIYSFLQICSRLLKKFFTENLIFYSSVINFLKLFQHLYKKTFYSCLPDLFAEKNQLYYSKLYIVRDVDRHNRSNRNSWYKQDFSILFSDSESRKKVLSYDWPSLFIKVKCWGAMVRQMCQNIFFDFGTPFWIMMSSVKMLICVVFSCDRKITGDNFMLISVLYQGLWVIQFYQVLYENNWEFELSDWENLNIWRIINCRAMNFFQKHLK